MVAVALAGLLALTATAPVASPSAAATEAPLHEIARVRATTPFCKTALELASNGVGIALQNDVRVANTEATLRKTDFDSNDLAKSNGLIELNRQYVELRAEAVRGNGVLKDLKTQAALAPSDGQRHDLLAFADALDGALGRQKRLADAIGRLIVILGFHSPIDANQQAENEINALYLANASFGYHDPEGPLHDLPVPLGKIASDGAGELEQRAAPVQDDESKAATLIDPAFARC